MYETRNLTICYSLANCFNNTFTRGAKIEHKIRVCTENQSEEFLLIFLVLLNFLSVSSVIASVKLENLTDYMYFYKSTKKFLCFPTNPVVHRSLVFTLASSDEHQDLLEEVAKDTVMINRPRRGETPLHYSTRMGAAMCTEILLRKGAELKENGEDPPVVPQVIKFAVKAGYAPILDTVAKIKRTKTGREIMASQIMASLQQDRTLLKASLNSPAIVRPMLNLVLPLSIGGEFVKTAELEFVEDRLKELNQSQDESEDILTVPTILSLIRWENQRGITVWEDETVGEDNLKVMLALAWGVLNRDQDQDQDQALIPEVRKGIVKIKDSDFIKSLTEKSPLTSTTLTDLMRHKNPEDKTILKETALIRTTYKILLSLAITDLNDQNYGLRSEIRKELDQIEEQDLLKDLFQEMKISTITSLVIYDVKGKMKVSDFHPRMVQIISKERHDEVKEVLETIKSLSDPEVRRALGLKAIPYRY